MSDLSNKVKAAITRLQTFAPKDGDKYFLCYSGGKDSDCIRILAALADVPHEIHHCLTTVDAPETVVNCSHISECVNGKRKTAGGYHWKNRNTGSGSGF